MTKFVSNYVCIEISEKNCYDMKIITILSRGYRVMCSVYRYINYMRYKYNATNTLLIIKELYNQF